MYGSINDLERMLAQAERTRERAQARIDLLMSLPKEPTTDDPDGALVVWFERDFGGSKKYTYAVVKASDGLWYTTGPNSPKGYTWEQFVMWLPTGTALWLAGSWEPLA